MQQVVSIITPTYNSEKFIADAIRSVQAQTYVHWEMLIVDDCSTDRTTAVVAPFLADARVKLIELDVNSGSGIARDTGIQNAAGRYIAFLDSDDLWLPEKLQRQIDFMRQTAQPFTFSFYECIDEFGNPLKKRIEAPSPLTYRKLFFCNFVGNLTGIYDADFFGKIRISSIRKRQDWIVWLEILKKIRSAKPVPESLALYRVHATSLSASKTKLLRYNYVVYRKFHRLNAFLAAMCLLIFLFVQLFVKPTYTKSI